jgi:hypothetical protein
VTLADLKSVKLKKVQPSSSTTTATTTTTTGSKNGTSPSPVVSRNISQLKRRFEKRLATSSSTFHPHKTGKSPSNLLFPSISEENKENISSLNSPSPLVVAVAAK